MNTKKTLKIFACEKVQVRDKVFSVSVETTYYDTLIPFVWIETDVLESYRWATSLARGPSVSSLVFNSQKAVSLC